MFYDTLSGKSSRRYSLVVVSTGSSLVFYKIFLFHSDSLYNLASFSNNRESCPFNEKLWFLMNNVVVLALLH